MVKQQKLVFEVPDDDTPSFLRRQRQGMAYFQRLETAGADPTLIDEVIEFLLPCVTQPKDRDEAREALLDASKRQYMDLLAAATGGAVEDPTPDESESTK